MTVEQTEHCLRLLRRCREGDEIAYTRLTAIVAEDFAWMIRGITHSDPTIDKEDLEQHFRLGIWQAIDKVRDVGDPIYHLAWRGRKEVLTLLKVWKRRYLGMDGQGRIEFESPRVDSLERMLDAGCYREPSGDPEHEPENVLLVQERRREAERHLSRLLASASLSERQTEAWAWMSRHPDELEEFGSGRRMARSLGVSEQAASKLRRRVVERMLAAQ